MKRVIMVSVAAVAVLVIGVIASGNKPESKTASDGPTIFTEQKCNSCHSVDLAGIKKTSKSTSNKAPDLSEVGNMHDAQWLAKWLQKTETIEGRKHVVTFRGNEAQLAEVTSWLATLKGKQGKGAGE